MVIRVIELGGEQELAAFSLGDRVESFSSFHLSPDGRQLFLAFISGPSLLYDVESGASREVSLADRLGPDDNLNLLAWSPSGQWISIETLHSTNSSRSLWAYSLQTDSLVLVDKVWRPSRWSSLDDRLTYQLDVQGAPNTVYDPASGEKTVWTLPRSEEYFALFTLDGVPTESWGCLRCNYPELGMVRESTRYAREQNRFYYQLIDIENVTMLAHVAIFETQREIIDDYQLDVLKLTPLWQRGDYLIFVQEMHGFAAGEFSQRYFTAWNPQGELPFVVTEDEQANKLYDVIPMALSPDEASFVGFRLEVQDDVPWLTQVIVIDLASSEILYEYELPAQTASFFDPFLFGVDLVWPSE